LYFRGGGGPKKDGGPGAGAGDPRVYLRQPTDGGDAGGAGGRDGGGPESSWRRRLFARWWCRRRDHRSLLRPTSDENNKKEKKRRRSSAPPLLPLLSLVLVVLSLSMFLLFPLLFGSDRVRRPSRAGGTAVVDEANKKPPPSPILPDDGVRVSVVVMNHGRPRMVRESSLLRTMVAHPAVSEVLLCHSNPSTAFRYDHPKVRNVDAVEADRAMGLSLRFHFCRNATNDWVVHVDDDMELASGAIDGLLAEFRRDPHRIVGRYGRSYNYWWNLHRNGYDTANVDGNVEVVLTKILVMERRICDAFFEYANVVSYDLLPESRPLWNGEDIFVNLVANHVYGRERAKHRAGDGGGGDSGPLRQPEREEFHNYALSDLDVWEASDQYKDDDTGERDVSGNMDRHRPWNVGVVNWWRAYVRSQKHAAYRGRLWSVAKTRLAKLDY